VLDVFRDAFGAEPAGVWAAPGRVNLIGEHTDYNEGFVLPFALQHQAVVAAGPARSSGSRARSIQRSGEVSFSVSTVEAGLVKGWGAYVAGMFWAIREAGYEIGDMDLIVDGRVPLGAGLSSSAALECSVGLAVVDLFDLGTERTELAMLARTAENQFVGAPTGGMDQLASMRGKQGHAVFIDTRTNAVELVPLPLDDRLALVVIDTHIHHTLVDSEYATRRKTCARAARQLGVQALRDITIDDLPAALAALDTDTERSRVRHVVTENARVLDTVDALRTGASGAEIGALLNKSHASLRDDYEVSTPELDQAVASAIDAGAYGARMTGGGFGGSAIALTPGDHVSDVMRGVSGAFANAGWAAPDCFVAVPSDGARRLG
jgi:galactokinase